MPAPGKPCKSDREKFCPGLKPGDGKLGPCMNLNPAVGGFEVPVLRPASTIGCVMWEP